MVVRSGRRKACILSHRLAQIALVALAAAGFGVRESFAQG